MTKTPKITIIQKDPDLSMASCGYPYYVGGVFDDRNMLLSTPDRGCPKPDVFYERKKHYRPHRHGGCFDKPRCKNSAVQKPANRRNDELPYDSLILATGSTEYAAGAGDRA